MLHSMSNHTVLLIILCPSAGNAAVLSDSGSPFTMNSVNAYLVAATQLTNGMVQPLRDHPTKGCHGFRAYLHSMIHAESARALSSHIFFAFLWSPKHTDPRHYTHPRYPYLSHPRQSWKTNGQHSFSLFHVRRTISGISCKLLDTI